MRRLLALALVAGVVGRGFTESTEMPSSIQDVKAKYEHELMAQPGVVSVGIGRDAQSTAVIVIGLDRERPEIIEKLPKKLDGFSVRVEILGTLRAR